MAAIESLTWAAGVGYVLVLVFTLIVAALGRKALRQGADLELEIKAPPFSVKLRTCGREAAQSAVYASTAADDRPSLDGSASEPKVV